MRAIVKLAAADGALEVLEVADPAPAADRVLVRITAGGVCGTDVAIWHHHEAVVGQYGTRFPRIVGHEFAGIVEAAPEGSGLSAGDVVAINPQVGCGHCRWCGLGRPTLCDDRRLMGGHVDGGWTEKVSVALPQVHRLPEGSEPAIAPLLEPMAVAVHSVFERVPVTTGDVVAVIGAGPIGLLCGILSLEAGASEVLITGIGADASRLELARSLGMTPVNAEAEDPRAVLDTLGEAGADIVYETSGSAAVAGQMLGLAGKAGRIGLIGLCHGPSTFLTTPAVLRELEIIGSRGYNDPTWRQTMRVLPRVAGRLAPLITHRFPFESFGDALATVERREGLKVLLTP